MALYRYKATMSSREDYAEKGTVIAQNEQEAKRKLKALRFDKISLRRVNAVRAMFGKFSATVK